jgi:hypothetical protein
LGPGPNPELDDHPLLVVHGYTPHLKVISYSFQRLNNYFTHTSNVATQVE